jgi:hypothetical protein
MAVIDWKELAEMEARGKLAQIKLRKLLWTGQDQDMLKMVSVVGN